LSSDWVSPTFPSFSVPSLKLKTPPLFLFFTSRKIFGYSWADCVNPAPWDFGVFSLIFPPVLRPPHPLSEGLLSSSEPVSFCVFSVGVVCCSFRLCHVYSDPPFFCISPPRKGISGTSGITFFHVSFPSSFSPTALSLTFKVFSVRVHTRSPDTAWRSREVQIVMGYPVFWSAAAQFHFPVFWLR